MKAANIQLRQEIYERKLIENKLTGLTSQIHNSIKNKQDSIKFFLRQSQLLIHESKAKALTNISIAKRLIFHVSNVTRNMLFLTKNKECAFSELIKEMELRAEITLANRNIHYCITRSNISEDEILKPELVQYILEIYTGLINNIVKHSQAENVAIEINYDGAEYIFTIQDDGIGFDYNREKNKDGAYGLEILEQLTSNINASLIFNSNHNHGTFVKAALS